VSVLLACLTPLALGAGISFTNWLTAAKPKPGPQPAKPHTPKPPTKPKPTPKPAPAT
jgi:hypothetical protein